MYTVCSGADLPVPNPTTENTMPTRTDGLGQQHDLTREECAVYDLVCDEGTFCAWQATAAEQATATRLTRQGLLESSPGNGCGKRHYRVS